jgi:two-component system cell cycle sensor histidine kinase/response regulator CckA
MVLLVEDERLVRNLVREILTHAGYEVVATASAEEALERASSLGDTIKLVLTDVVLPGLDGTQLAERLRPTMPQTKFIFMSGNLDTSRQRDAVAAEGETFLQKPFTRVQLLAIVADLIGPPPPGAGGTRRRN